MPPGPNDGQVELPPPDVDEYLDVVEVRVQVLDDILEQLEEEPSIELANEFRDEVYSVGQGRFRVFFFSLSSAQDQSCCFLPAARLELLGTWS